MMLMSLFVDAWTVSTSMVDIVTDVLVCKQFHDAGHVAYFYLSVSIFVAASAAYALLFASTYVASGRGLLTRVSVFFVALPFSQLLPIFHWLESFHFVAIDQLLWKTGVLSPTAVATSSPKIVEDQLWTMIQKSYSKHAGFMIEAIVEALPQAALQTYASAAGAANATAVTIISVLMSALVLISKGYLLSYSIQPLVAVFNASCVATDLISTLATASWLATDIHYDQIGHWILTTLFWALSCLFIGLACAHFFVVCDDHLKQWRPSISRPRLSIADSPVWFELYLVRGFALLCAYLPVMAVFATARLLYIPLFVFHSLDAQHALHSNFYSFIFRDWLRGSKRILRLEALNEIITAVHRSVPALERAIRVNPDPFEHAFVRRKWLKVLATPNEWRAAPLKRHGAIRWQQSDRNRTMNNDDIFRIENNFNDSDNIDTKQEDAVKGTVCRRLLHFFWFDMLSESEREGATKFWNDLLLRSDILSFYDRSGGDLGGAPPTLSLVKYPLQSLLIVFGSASLILGIVLLVTFIPIALVYHGLAAVYSPFCFFRLLLYRNESHQHNPIAIALTVTMLIVAVPLFFLAPHVHRFRSSRDGLAETRDLPEFLYDSKLLRGVITRRYLTIRAHEAIREYIVTRLHGSSDVTDYILDRFLGGDRFFKYDTRGLDLWRIWSFLQQDDEHDQKKSSRITCCL